MSNRFPAMSDDEARLRVASLRLLEALQDFWSSLPGGEAARVAIACERTAEAARTLLGDVGPTSPSYEGRATLLDGLIEMEFEVGGKVKRKQRKGRS